MSNELYNRTVAVIKKLPTDIFGLKFLPTIAPEHDDDRDIPLWDGGVTPIAREFSDCNMQTIDKVVAELGDKLKAVMEIGVDRVSQNDSISKHVFNNRPLGSFYLGIDIEDKSYLNNEATNTWTLQCNSHEQDKIREFLKSKNIQELDLLVIDGWHSVNTTINDWKYADLLSPHGIVVVHDTNYHPGDIALLEAVDESLFDIDRACIDPSDSGLTVLRRKQ